MQDVVKVARLKLSADFERLLGTPVKQRTAHFAIHHVPSAPGLMAQQVTQVRQDELSTDRPETCPLVVDDSLKSLWLGCLVPKRHARRSVTRSLLKRQMRSAAERAAAQLPTGIALLRLRQPFVLNQYPSAASEALRQAARLELDQLVQRFVAAVRKPETVR